MATPPSGKVLQPFILLFCLGMSLLAGEIAAATGGIIRCAHMNATIAADDNRTEDCPLRSSDHANNGKMAFCYKLFQNTSNGDNETATLQSNLGGCWVGGEHECVEHAHGHVNGTACYTRKKGEATLLFCCCLEDMCNLHMTPVPSSEYISSRDTPLPGLPSDEPKDDNTVSIVLRFIIVPAAGLILIGGLSYCGLRRHRLSRLPQNQFGYDNQFEKSPSEMASPMVTLKNVELVQLAAQGRFGSVYRGRHHDAPVAVKVFPAGERQSWERELEVYKLPQMQHPNVLRFIGHGQQNSTQTGLTEYWLLTSWHDLGSLHDYLRFHKINYSQLLHIADSVAKGMMHLHTEAEAVGSENYKPAMAHRDIKSKNILLKDDKTACIADFGLAIIFERGANIGEIHGQVGTRRYMAPEVLEGAISFDQEAFQRIDMYAVSLVLWEILTRTIECDPFPEFRMPFEDQVGQHPTLEAMQETVVKQKLRPPIRESWRENKNISLLVSTLEDCWDADADARLNACTVHERLQYLISNQWATEIGATECTALLPPNGINGLNGPNHIL